MSCLFNTLCKFVDLNGKQLRENICSYMRNNPIIIDEIKIEQFVEGHDEFNNIEEYVDKMKNTSTWGGAIEIKLFCNMYNKSVLVHNTQDNKDIEFLPYGKYSKNDIIKINWNGGHYWV